MQNYQKLSYIKQDNQGQFLIRFLRSLLKAGFHLIGNALKPLAKSILIPLGLTAEASATDAAIHKTCSYLVIQN